MFSTTDTIVAIATPLGRSGIGVIRLSGSEASTLALQLLTTDRGTLESLRPRHATLALIRAAAVRREPAVSAPDLHHDPAGSRTSEPRGEGFLIDQVVATYFPSPNSYTGEDVVEISAHGSPVLLREILDAAIAAGARLAEPGEFTLRAYLNGRLDLVQAEAVRDLIDSVTPLQARAAFDQLHGTLTEVIKSIDATLFDLIARLEASLDFPDEGYHFLEPEQAVREITEVQTRIADLLRHAHRGRLIREGRTVAIVGRPNTGKSTLFNFFLSADRAIVTEIPGTTRDLLTERASVEGVPVTLIDTAGVHDTADLIEREGIERALRAAETAHAILLVLDTSRQLDREDEQLLRRTERFPRLLVVNKIDRPRLWTVADLQPDSSPVVEVSLMTRAGTERLASAVVQLLSGEHSYDGSEEVTITNTRHIALLEQANQALTRAASTARDRASEEFVLVDLQSARGVLEEITGRRADDSLLRHIFDHFCIGK